VVRSQQKKRLANDLT